MSRTRPDHDMTEQDRSCSYSESLRQDLRALWMRVIARRAPDVAEAITMPGMQSIPEGTDPGPFLQAANIWFQLLKIVEENAAIRTQRNVETLMNDGAFFVGPDAGDMACGEFGDVRVPSFDYKRVNGGLLVQDRDFGRISKDDLKIVTKLAPTDAQLEDLLFAWRVAKHVKSNTIVYAKDRATVGIGAGQMSRIDSARIAARKAEDAKEKEGFDTLRTTGCVAASDAFFPFPDGMLAAAAAGASAIIQPGGSIRDDEVIAAADEAGLAMVLTGMRHFRH